eukprot:COSAG02_NODE_3219_length_7155_cov_4.534864_5_plen_61_part_00
MPGVTSHLTVGPRSQKVPGLKSSTCSTAGSTKYGWVHCIYRMIVEVEVGVERTSGRPLEL